MSARFERGLNGPVTLSLLDDLYGLPVERRIAWLRTKVAQGDSALFAHHLARNLWIMAATRERQSGRPTEHVEAITAEGSAPEEDAEDETAGFGGIGRELRAEAVRQALLAYVALRVNAPLCRDGTSPDGFLHQLGTDLQPMLAFLAALPAGDRGGIVADALRREARMNLTARGDNLLCQRGVHAGRYCAEGAPPGSCPKDPAPFAEFMPDDVVQPHRQAMRRKARLEIEALAR